MSNLATVIGTFVETLSVEVCPLGASIKVIPTRWGGGYYIPKT